MVWFKNKGEEIARQNWEMATAFKLAEMKIEQKDKEIAMWIERGNRLSGSFDTLKEENDKLRELFVRLVSGEIRLEAMKEAIAFNKEKP